MAPKSLRNLWKNGKIYDVGRRGIERQSDMVQALDVAFLRIGELGQLYRRREVSPVEVTAQLLARAESLQAEIHAFITLTPEIAMAQARAAEAAFLQGEALPA